MQFRAQRRDVRCCKEHPLPFKVRPTGPAAFVPLGTPLLSCSDRLRVRSAAGSGSDVQILWLLGITLYCICIEKCMSSSVVSVLFA